MYHKTTSCANALDIEMRKFAEQENEREACGLKNHNPQKICSIAREILNWWIKNQTTQKRHKVKKKNPKTIRSKSVALFFHIFTPLQCGFSRKVQASEQLILEVSLLCLLFFFSASFQLCQCFLDFRYSQTRV